jgi:hypothetical protein
MKTKTIQTLKVRRIVAFKKLVNSTSFWETDPITVTMATVTHMVVLNK